MKPNTVMALIVFFIMVVVVEGFTVINTQNAEIENKFSKIEQECYSSGGAFVRFGYYRYNANSDWKHLCLRQTTIEDIGE